jgi:hypothetical protein
MRWFSESWSLEQIAEWMKTCAAGGHYTGIMTPAAKRYLDHCKAAHRPSGSILIFTRDAGMHSSGWWKNPDYERCWHLSLSFRDPVTGAVRPRDKQWTRIWIDVIFGPLKTLIWTEPPYYPEGKKSDVYHFRVFFSEDWRSPILPRDEVYTRTHTPADWLSWSDARAKLELEPIKVEGLPE